MKRRGLALLFVLPVVAATAVAGTITAPWRIRPCVSSYSTGFTGGPTHVELGPDGNLWANEGQNDRIAKFDIQLKRVTAEYSVPKGTQLHDLVPGPDGNVWFTGNANILGRLNIHTGKITLFPGLRGAGNPHMWWAPDGYLYVSEVAAGRLARFDPKTEQVTDSQYNLPRNNGIHSFAQVPGGNTWWGLEYVDKLARFNIHTHRFDEFVDLRGGHGPHWLTYVPSDDAVWIAVAYSNNLARFDLRTHNLTYMATPIPPASPSLFTGFALFAYLTHMLADANGRFLWIATLGGRELLRVDLRTHRLKKVYCGLGALGVTIVLARDRAGNMWVSEPFDKSLGKIHGETDGS